MIKACFVTTYYNPAAYKSRLDAFSLFQKHLRKDIPLFVLEIHNKLDASQLTDVDPNTHIIDISYDGAPSWSKEKSINWFVATQLDSSFTHVIVVDCDLIWDSYDWVEEALSSGHLVYQPFSKMVHLTRSNELPEIDPRIIQSFVSKNQKRSAAFFYGNACGGCWVINRELWNSGLGLFDKLPHPHTDVLIAAAFHGKPESSYVCKELPEKLKTEYLFWAKSVTSWVGDKIGGSLDRAVKHCWHGDDIGRHVTKLFLFLIHHKFDPGIHMKDCGNHYEFAESLFANRFSNFFNEKEEDGPIRYLEVNGLTIRIVASDHTGTAYRLVDQNSTSRDFLPNTTKRSRLQTKRTTFNNKTAWIIPFFSFYLDKVMNQNFNEFINQFSTLDNVFVIELACFEDQQFYRPESKNFIRLNPTKHSFMWQKERLLNIALSNIPQEFGNIVWSDSDILFPDSISSIEHDLDLKLIDHSVVHMFKNVEWLESDKTRRVTFKSVTQNCGGAFGHPGYVWGCRREELDKIGFFDYHITGNGDTLMYFLMNQYIESWARKFFNLPGMKYVSSLYNQRVQKYMLSDIGNLDITIKHLFHGEYKKRNYENRHKILLDSGYDPVAMLKHNESGLFEFTSAGYDIQRQILKYCNYRKENDYV